MLGSFSRGMKVLVPARFQDGSKKPVPVENVVIKIEHFNHNDRRVIQDLIEQPMRQLSPSDYMYEYEIPTNAELNTYTVYITAKIPNSKQKVFEAVEQFNVIEPEKVEEREPIKVIQDDISVGFDNYVPPKINTTNLTQSVNNIIVKDIVVDVENKPIKGVHINVYTKADYIPKDVNNIKLASTMSDENGEWQVELPKGDYVFVYKGIGFREYREIRRV